MNDKPRGTRDKKKPKGEDEMIAEPISEVEELMTAEEARALLDVSSVRMAALLKKGVLSWERSPLDGRVKLVKRSEVEALARKAGKRI
jgi:hypothetical protein